MSPASPFHRSIGVVIGIDQYVDGIPQLRTAVNDARRLGELLAGSHGYQVTALLDADASAARLTQLLTVDLPALVQPDDRVLFYFAGHGVARDGDEGPNGYLLPADARRGDDSTYLHMPLVHDALLALPCRHMLVVLDSCFSGAFRWSGTRDIMEEFDVVHQEKYDRFVRDPAWQVITSASQDQKAIDQLTAGALGTRESNGEHSPFAAALFDAISGKGDLIPTDGGDGLVTATELYLYLEESLQQAASSVGASQTPRLWPLRKHDKGEFVFFVPGRELTLPPAPELTFERNPWGGLSSYDAGNAALFFGRDAEIEALRDRITAQSLTVVLGASGTGKSSLVKAGALPRLRADGWHVLPVMRPGSTPMAALALTLTTADGPVVAATADAITARVHEVVTQHAPHPVLLVIDQFEELITLARTADERTALLALLAALVRQHPDGLRLVVTIRTDFEPNFDSTAFGAMWTDGRYVIPPMSRENMRKVIEQPAAARVLYFEPSKLVETLLDEVVATPGALPLLSFALSEMYIAFVKRQGGDRAITQADYEALGGVAGALRSRAESEHAALDEAHRATLRRVMLRLVSSDGGGIARRRATDAELTFADPDEQVRADHVVTRLTAARLLVEGREADGESFVEPAHDALVRGWGRLLEWVRDEGDAAFPLLQQQRLARSAEEWERTGEGSRDGLLWRDAARSAQLSPLVRRKAPWLNARELAFAKRSVRGRNLARATAAAAVLLIAGAGIAAALAGVRATRRAEEVRVTSIIRTAQSLTTEDPLLAALLLGSIDSAMVARLDDGARLSLIGTAMQLRSAPQVDMTFGTRPPIETATISPDGVWLVASEVAGDVWLHNLKTGASRPLPFVLQSTFATATFNRASSLVAVGTTDGQLIILPVRDGDVEPLKLTASEAVTELAFDSIGSALLSVDTAGTLQVYDLSAAATMRTPEETTTPGAAVTMTVARTAIARFLNGGRVAIVDHDGVLSVLSPRGTREVSLPHDTADAIVTIVPSPDGRRIAIAGNSGSLRLFDHARRRVSRLAAHRAAIPAMAWSHDGVQLVTASLDNTVGLWNTRSLALKRRFERSDEPMQTLDFSEDGRQFIGSSAYTYRAVLFDTAGAMAPLVGHTAEILTARIVDGGHRYATVARDGGIWLWSPPPPPMHQATMVMEKERPDGGDVSAIAFSPDSRQVALGTRDGWVYRYRLDSPSPATPFATDTGTFRAMQWSRDGHTLHALTFEGVRFHWPTDRPISPQGGTPSPLDAHLVSTTSADGSSTARRVTASPVDVFLLATTPAGDGRHAMAVSTDGDVTVWDLADSTPPLRVPLVPTAIACRDPADPKYEPANDVDCVPVHPECAAISGDAQWVATCRPDNTVVLYARDGSRTKRIFSTSRGTISSVALSHDGSLLAAGLDSVVHLWRTATPGEAGRDVGAGDLAVQRLAFSPDASRLAARNVDGWVRVVDVTSGVSLVTVRPRGESLDDMGFTPDSRYLLTLGVGEREARLWNVSGAGGSLPINAGGRLIEALAISPDGRWMVASNDRQGAQLQALDADLAITPFRTMSICLSASRRERYLLETAAIARERYAQCERRPRVGDANVERARTQP